MRSRRACCSAPEPGHCFTTSAITGCLSFVAKPKLLIDRRSHLERESENIERALSITPEDQGISQFLERLRAATERLTALNGQAKQLDA